MNLGRFITMTSPVPFQDKREYAQAQLTQAVGDGRLDLGRFSDLVGTVWETDDIATIDRITREVAVVPNSSVEQTGADSTCYSADRHTNTTGGHLWHP